MKIHCLKVGVYRNNVIGDCTNGGISGRFDSLLIACPDGPITFDSDIETPLNFCMIERRRIFGDTIVMNVVPACVDEFGFIVRRPGWWMSGGNIANSSDGRFSQMKGHFYPLEIHDRQE